MKRIEISLTEEIAEAIQKKAEVMNHSRKSYIEFLCMQDVTQTVLKKQKRDGEKITITNTQLLCQLYFEIVEEFISADEIRKRLDKKIKFVKRQGKYKIIESH